MKRRTPSRRRLWLRGVGLIRDNGMTNPRPLHDTWPNCHRYVGLMKSSQSSHRTRGRSILGLLLLAIATAASSPAQYTPLISGGAGFFTNTNGGNTSYFPTISPVLAMPLTDR